MECCHVFTEPELSATQAADCNASREQPMFAPSDPPPPPFSTHLPRHTQGVRALVFSCAEGCFAMPQLNPMQLDPSVVDGPPPILAPSPHKLPGLPMITGPDNQMLVLYGVQHCLQCPLYLLHLSVRASLKPKWNPSPGSSQPAAFSQRAALNEVIFFSSRSKDGWTLTDFWLSGVQK